MKRALYVFLLFLVINSVFSSECTNKKATIQNETSSDTTISSQIATTTPGSQATESTTTTSSATESTTQAETESTTQAETDTTTQTETEAIEEDNEEETTEDRRRRRILQLLNEDDCKNLKTQDDNKYQCVVNSQHTECEEVEKEGSNILYLSSCLFMILTILAIL